MQIHEITQRRTDEGLWNKAMALGNYYAGDYDKSAEYSQKELQQQQQDGKGRNLEKETDPKQSWKKKQENLAKTPGMTTYITGLAQEWIKSPDAQPATPTPPASRAAPGQMPASVAASKTGQNMQQMFGQPRGGIQGMQSDLEEAAPMSTPVAQNVAKLKQQRLARTTAPAITAPAITSPTITAPATAAPTDYAGKFKKWSDEKLATKVDGTFNQFVTMDQVRNEIPDLKKELDSALVQITNTQGTAQHTAAIQKYLELASAGVQAVGQQKRYIATQAKYKPSNPNDPNSATNQLGLTPRQTQGLKALAQTPAGKAQILKDLGIV
jgi:hypothetical protein